MIDRGFPPPNTPQCFLLYPMPSVLAARSHLLVAGVAMQSLRPTA
ncbi:MAG: hypothetical protein KatS3mg111_2571 [Pirellulaceae bacterium]|nr:MAG: hypothetical protein KatS3mg111_2571 [Pirellulaceae bacterium]